METRRSGKSLLIWMVTGYLVFCILMAVVYSNRPHRKASFGDLLISGGVYAQYPCPLGCGNPAKQYRDNDEYFWRCGACSPGLTFRNVDGKPVLEK